jgi:hypothetical protein
MNCDQQTARGEAALPTLQHDEGMLGKRTALFSDLTVSRALQHIACEVLHFD